MCISASSKVSKNKSCLCYLSTPSNLYQLRSFGYYSRDICLLSIKWNWTVPVLWCSKPPINTSINKNLKKKHAKHQSLSRNHDPVTQHNLQTSLWAISWRNYFFVYHLTEGNIDLLLDQLLAKQASIVPQWMRSPLMFTSHPVCVSFLLSVDACFLDSSLQLHGEIWSKVKILIFGCNYDHHKWSPIKFILK